MQKKKKPILILMAGSSGSGKSTVANELIKGLPSDVTGLVICQDRYYFDPKTIGKKPEEINFDHPSAFNWELMKQNINELLNNKPVELPIYNYVSHSQLQNKELVQPADIIILEGIHAFHNPEINKMANLLVFIDTSKDESFIRRLERDVKQRGRTIDSVITQWREMVRPMYDAFIEPLKIHANIIIPWNGSQKTAVQIIKRGIAETLKENELLQQQ